MREFRTPAVVVGIDGSKPAIYAALWAVDEAISRDIPMRLVYVIDPLDPAVVGDHDGRQAAAATALHDAREAAESTGKTVKIETEILWGKPVTRLMEESRSAAMVCIGSIGLNHAVRGGGSVAATLGSSALCPVAVINRPADGTATPKVSGIVVGVDNGLVLRHAFEEARLRKVPLRAVSPHLPEAPDSTSDGNRLARTQLSRRIARWTRLYPDVRVESEIIGGSVKRYLAANAGSDQLFVTESHECQDVCGAPDVRCSVLAIRCSNL
ncbi:universal stress protein [Mycobacterium lacus]|uniref:Universal stress protein n=1 Tax=Mycobacterium lacus TaxID=169765 RepID=A0A1X1YD27_9MYCO|nr:universal stress protein [Mycobacterium lacus]MCV7124765.1 universal stress protein [Mycobacterium lacus]ORW08993.1 universal stress protein [Mycobacterium lacus]BBX97780.1 universal stress protein [Mycobacterium lacus]